MYLKWVLHYGATFPFLSQILFILTPKHRILMKINVHAHVFNFQSILTKETILLLSHRLTGQNLPEPLRDAILSYLRTRRKSRSGDISFDDFHRTIRRTRIFNRLIPGRLRRLFDRHLDLPPSAETRAVLTSLIEASLVDRNIAATSPVINAFEWLRIGFMNSIDAVTDDLITQMDDDDVAVVLPMDILDRNAGKKERGLFPTQLDDTKRQALRYPGRILPFAKVNPARTDSYEIFRDSVESGACVGLKLYPSLGYSIQGDNMNNTMNAVLDLCNELEVPVLLHCNDAGFRKSPIDAQFCNPGHWLPVLDKHANLKVCFGHFGGQSQNGKAVWTAPSLPDDSWASAILDMMERYPGRVYADVSYHSEQHKNSAAAENYRKNLLAVLSDDRYRRQVLWGTDYHLLRMDATDTDYTREFLDLVGEELFTMISQHNPAGYLGLPNQNKPEGKNITRHMNWLTQNNARAVRGKPASWLMAHPAGAAIEGTNGTGVSADGPAWDLNNRIHTSVFNFLWNYKNPSCLNDRIKRKMKDQGERPEALFEAMGRLPIGELTFHRDVLGDQTDRNHAIRSFAGRIHIWFSNISAFERYNSSESEFYRKMISTCSDPAATVPKIAEIMELFFRMKPDLVTDTNGN